MVIWMMKALAMTKSPTVSVPSWTPTAAMAITATSPAVMMQLCPPLRKASELAVDTAASS